MCGCCLITIVIIARFIRIVEKRLQGETGKNTNDCREWQTKKKGGKAILKDIINFRENKITIFDTIFF